MDGGAGRILWVAGTPLEKEDSWLFSSMEWEDFVLELEFFVPEKCNSGIGIRMPKDSAGSPDVHGYEVQISDLPQKKLTGSLLHHVGVNRQTTIIFRINGNQLAIICEVRSHQGLPEPAENIG
ncbi:MAG: family 16 glycoside hydrolase [Bacteroidota bacterium]